MFKMVNRYGNAVCMVNSEKEREEFLIRGYHEEEIETEKIDFNKMKVEELEKYAEEKGIDLTGCANKAEKIAKIEESITD